MTTQEAIETLKLMQGQIEWDYPMEYAVAVDMAVVALQKQISQKPVPDGYGSQCPVTVKDVKEALKTVLYAFSNCSDIPNSSDLVSRSYLLTEYDRQHQGPPGGARKIIEEAPPVQASTSQTKFKPGDKFILEIGEKRIGLDEYSIVGTDLYVWGSLLEKLTPYEPTGDAISRQDAIGALCAGCGEYSDGGCTFRKYVGGCPNYDFMTSLPSVQTEQKKGHWIPVDDPSITGRCSVCGFESHLCEDDVYGYDYCPNCGAKMESDDK